METSLRFGGDDKQLRLHAKEKFLLDSAFCLEVRGALNTRNGAVGCVAHLKRKFLPELLSTLDVGAKFDTQLRELTYDVKAKKTLPLTDNGLLTVDIKGGFNFNPRIKLGKSRGGVELSYKIFNFTEDQDLKVKLGYDPFNQVKHAQSKLHGRKSCCLVCFSEAIYSIEREQLDSKR